MSKSIKKFAKKYRSKSMSKYVNVSKKYVKKYVNVKKVCQDEIDEKQMVYVKITTIIKNTDFRNSPTDGRTPPDIWVTRSVKNGGYHKRNTIFFDIFQNINNLNPHIVTF